MAGATLQFGFYMGGGTVRLCMVCPLIQRLKTPSVSYLVCVCICEWCWKANAKFICMPLCLPPPHLPYRVLCPMPCPCCLLPGRPLCWSCRVRAIANCGVLCRAMLLSCPCIPVLLCLRSCARVCSCAFCWAEVDRESTPSAKLKALCNSARVCLGALCLSSCNSARVCLGPFVYHLCTLRGYVWGPCVLCLTL